MLVEQTARPANQSAGIWLGTGAALPLVSPVQRGPWLLSQTARSRNFLGAFKSPDSFKDKYSSHRQRASQNLRVLNARSDSAKWF